VQDPPDQRPRFSFRRTLPDKDIKFDLLEAARRGIGRTTAISAAMDALKASIQTILPAVLTSARTRTPDDYKDWLSGRVAMWSRMMITFSNRSSAMERPKNAP
jgi:hypothetical protein